MNSRYNTHLWCIWANSHTPLFRGRASLNMWTTTYKTTQMDNKLLSGWAILPLPQKKLCVTVYFFKLSPSPLLGCLRISFLPPDCSRWKPSHPKPSGLTSLVYYCHSNRVYLSHWKIICTSICNCNNVHVIKCPRLNIYSAVWKCKIIVCLSCLIKIVINQVSVLQKLKFLNFGLTV
jgi:hypothetical protein